MADIATFRKSKVELSDYDCSKDIQNRVFMSEFTPFDVEVMEEILYSSLCTPIAVLEKTLELSKAELIPILQKLSRTQLFTIKSDHVQVDKEMRKYYEAQILKFEEDFFPGMEYLQTLLRKVPIHILPSWYSFSRTADNIFNSIIEKYLHTPQIFQRYLNVDLNLKDSVQKGILSAVYHSPTYEVRVKDMLEKFSLTQKEFEEHMLYLEYNLVAVLRYKREGNVYQGVITPFQEWYDYLNHVKNTELQSIIDEENIVRTKPEDFTIIHELATVLEKASGYEDLEDIDILTSRLLDLQLAERVGNAVTVTEEGNQWLKMRDEDRAITLFRHPQPPLRDEEVPEPLLNERLIREAEKCLLRAVGARWVYLDEFLVGVYIPLKEEQAIVLRRIGRSWKYSLPEYSADERNFFRAMITSWLFEAGITAIGTHKGRECFRLTPFGETLFRNE